MHEPSMRVRAFQIAKPLRLNADMRPSRGPGPRDVLMTGLVELTD